MMDSYEKGLGTVVFGLFVIWMYASAFRISFTAGATPAGDPRTALMSLLFATLLSAAGFRFVYGRWPLPGLLSRPFWFGEPLTHKYAVLVVVAIGLQLVVPLDPVTALDIWLAPGTATIWLGVGYVVWQVGQAVRKRASST